MSAGQRYDCIGHGYSELRREDPRVAARVRAALGGARSVVNVGAGAGSYEPTAPLVLAVEPSQVMVSQRAESRAPAMRALAQALPLRDHSVDADTIHENGNNYNNCRNLDVQCRPCNVLLHRIG